MTWRSAASICSSSAGRKSSPSLLAGLAQLLGVDLPTLEGQSAGQLIMEALAIIFLRKGVKGDIGRA